MRRKVQHRLLFSLQTTFSPVHIPLSDLLSTVKCTAFLISDFFSGLTLAFCETKASGNTTGYLDPADLDPLSVITFAPKQLFEFLLLDCVCLGTIASLGRVATLFHVFQSGYIIPALQLCSSFWGHSLSSQYCLPPPPGLLFALGKDVVLLGIRGCSIVWSYTSQV